jgi:hypothetical protein
MGSCRQASFLLAFTIPLWGQGIKVGVKLGVPITQYFDTGSTAGNDYSVDYSSATRRYTVGASGEWRLKNGFGFEVDVLYHRIGYVAAASYFSESNGLYSISATKVKGNSWDFPMMAKYASVGQCGRTWQPAACFVMLGPCVSAARRQWVT